jgi:hypothetical protein
MLQIRVKWFHVFHRSIKRQLREDSDCDFQAVAQDLNISVNLI